MEEKNPVQMLLERLNRSRALLFDGLIPKCPDRILSWRPDISTESFGDLLLYTGVKEQIWAKGLKNGKWEMPGSIPKVPTTIDAAVKALAATHKNFLAAIEKVNKTKWFEPIATPFKTATRYEMLFDLYEDFLHLRAVMFLFAKLNGIPCPPMYREMPGGWMDPYKRLAKDLGMEKLYISGCRLNQGDE